MYERYPPIIPNLKSDVPIEFADKHVLDSLKNELWDREDMRVQAS